MNTKKFITGFLFLFLAASVVAPLARFALSRHSGGAAGIVPRRPDTIVVCYFRSKNRCPACRTLESSSREVVESAFASELAAGAIDWQIIDYQQPGNERLLDDYQLLTGGIVLMQFRDGRPVRWQALTETWNMTEDRSALVRHIEDSVRTFMKESP